MKIVFQIALGIIIAGGVLWPGGMMLTAAALQSYTDTLPNVATAHETGASPKNS